MIALKHDFAIGPAPIIAKTLESFFAKSFVASPGMAPVLAELKRFAAINARGAPVSTSFRINIRFERGIPMRRLFPLDPYHLHPAT